MIENIVKPLLRWYEDGHRTLPWRENKNPYYIWISEIMLQQTRVEAVKPFFERFIKALPTVRDVAVCPEEQLLKLWEGLGYYNRVRNIQKAAIILVEQYDGKLPEDYELLKSLPGIGNYTAGAIASIAYDLPVPAVDGNVLRVYARITEMYDDILKQSVKTKVEKELLKIMPLHGSGELNQAFMELGALVCVPNGAPKCQECPLKEVCIARKKGTSLQLPVKKKAASRKKEKKTILVIQDGERVAVRKRPSKGLLAGMYEFPNMEGHKSKEEIIEWGNSHGLMPLKITPLEKSKHIFSHVEWDMTGYSIRIAADHIPENSRQGDILFIDVKDIEKKYPVPAAFHAYAEYVNMKLGQEKYSK